MTRKDYQLIADVFLRSLSRCDRTEVSTIDRLAEDMALSLRSTNPRFDRARFLRACGVE